MEKLITLHPLWQKDNKVLFAIPGYMEIRRESSKMTHMPIGDSLLREVAEVLGGLNVH